MKRRNRGIQSLELSLAITRNYAIPDLPISKQLLARRFQILSGINSKDRAHDENLCLGAVKVFSLCLKKTDLEFV